MRFAEFLAQNKRWLFAGGLIALGSSFGQTFFISVFAGEIMAGFHLTDGQWGAIYSLGTTASAIVMLFAGTLSDRLRARTLASAVLLLMAGACLLMANVSAVWALPVAVFALRFTGQGMLSHISVVAIARWYSATRGKALAVANLGLSLGEALLPFGFVAMLAYVSWQTLWLVAAVGALALIPPLRILLKRERTPQSIVAEQNVTGMNGHHWSRRDVLSHWLFWALIPAITAPGIFSTALFFQQVHLSQSKGWEHTHFVALFPVYTTTLMIGLFAYGWAIDRIGCLRLFAMFQVPMALAYLAMGLGGSLVWAAVGFFLLGLMQGGGSTLFGAIWPELYGTRHLGAIKALAAALMVFGSAIGPGMTGALIDLGIPFQDQMVGFAAYILVVCFLTWLAMRRALASIRVSAAV